MARKLETLRDLYLEELRDLYHAESQLVRMLPEFAAAATSPALRHSFEQDLMRKQEHVERLKKIVSHLGSEPFGQRCKGMEGVLQEGRDLIQNGQSPAVLDAGLIVLAQKAQHYEIAGYGSVCTFAQILNRPQEEKILHQSLVEEKQADAALTDMARHTVNLSANTQSSAKPM